MVPTDVQVDLFATAGSSDAVHINSRCEIRIRDRFCVVAVAGVPVAHYGVGDRMAEAHAMVNLVEQDLADQNDVAAAFGYSARTLRRCQERFDAGGLAALGRRRGYPRGRSRLPGSRTRMVSRFKAQGKSNRDIALRLGVSEMAVRKLLKRLGWAAPQPEQMSLKLGTAGANPNMSAFTSPPLETPPITVPTPANPKLSAFSPAVDELPQISFDRNPADRSFDRLMAYLGLLSDAAPLFQSAARVPHAGVLLAIPAIAQSGVIDCAKNIYGSIGPAFYGLRTTVVALLLMALLRIKRPENLKEHPPVDLGRVLGLDRAPEVKTLRRKLTRLAALGRSIEFGRALAECRVALRGTALGFLYVDGHVRVYHGKRVIPKTHVARMRIAMPATTDYWVNDAKGEPLFVVTAEANAGMCKMLPALMTEVRKLIGERRTTVVFDRGGWSPKLFQKLINDGFDILTYRKGKCRPVPKTRFCKQAQVIDGRKVTYILADQGIRLLNGSLRLRQVTRLKDGHQTQVITSRRDLTAVEVAFRMFERWRQENFFKYLREEYAIDALVDYQAEPADPTREVPNPIWNALDAKLKKARAELLPLPAEYGVEALTNPEELRRTMRGFKVAHAKLGKEICVALKKCIDLEAKRDAVPRRVPVARTIDGDVVKLAVERKHLTSLLKMVAYQAESDLLRLVTPHYRRAEDEGRTLIQTALASAADIEVTDTELNIRLAPLSSKHRSYALAAICKNLNDTNTVFPGTRLRVRYAIDQAG